MAVLFYGIFLHMHTVQSCSTVVKHSLTYSAFFIFKVNTISIVEKT